MSKLPEDLQIVLNAIPLDQYISRTSLVIKTEFSDRKVRKCIQSLREKGYLIHSSNDHYGYKIANGKKETQEMIDVYKTRIKSQIIVLKGIMDEEELRQFIWIDCTQ